MFLWYIEFAAKDRQGEHAYPDSPDWQEKLIADAIAPAMTPHGETEKPRPLPSLKQAG
jgi:hypothetical protein